MFVFAPLFWTLVAALVVVATAALFLRALVAALLVLRRGGVTGLAMSTATLVLVRSEQLQHVCKRQNQSLQTIGVVIRNLRLRKR